MFNITHHNSIYGKESCILMLEVRNIEIDWIPVWEWQAFLVFFSGLILITVLLIIAIIMIVYSKKRFQEYRKSITSTAIGLVSFAYFIWFLVFNIVFWATSFPVETESGVWQYNVGVWFIAIIILTPVFFLSFLCNFVWFLNMLNKKEI